MTCTTPPFAGIEAGKYYVNHRGERVGPMHYLAKSVHGGYRWQDASGRLYTHCGRIWIMPIASDLDVKEECLDTSELATANPPPLEKSAPPPLPPPARPEKTGSISVSAALARAVLDDAAGQMLKAFDLLGSKQSDAAVRELLVAMESIARAAQIARFI